ncbi:MAG: hypothetical protein PHD72_02995 [Patescibacteria group bacterium]|nr:hypothetical protein [Patescibacteria group bacterium]
MDKKTLTTVLIVLGVVVVAGGAYWGYNRWQERRLAAQILKEMYGGAAGGLLGGGGISASLAEEMAKQAAKDEAKEAAMTPEDKFNETQEFAAYDDTSRAVSAEARGLVEKVFGKAKLVAFSSGYYGMGEGKGSGMASFEVSRLTTAADVGTFSKELTDQGMQILSSGVDTGTALIMAGNENAQYVINFTVGEQVVAVSIIKATE